MSGVSLGKKLLRNVIRHTDIHNKLQEEQDMWKLRGLEKTVLQSDTSSHKPPASASRGYMHCDRYEDDWSPSRNRGEVKGRVSEKQDRGPRLSERDEREARYWSRKLYEFEANDPDRWGHSGFKELYPEEFKSGSESSGDTNTRHRKKKCKSSRGEDEHRKHSRKTSRKKKKRKKEKEKKKKRKADASSSSSNSADSDGEMRRKRRKEEKRKVRRKKVERGRKEEESSSEDSDSEGEGDRERRSGGGGGGRRKRHRQTHQEVSRKKRKNWKTADEEKSDESSED